MAARGLGGGGQIRWRLAGHGVTGRAVVGGASLAGGGDREFARG
jgi:hypothetical protein